MRFKGFMGRPSAFRELLLIDRIQHCWRSAIRSSGRHLESRRSESQLPENLKSDVAAKEAFRDELRRRGFEARITAVPADITATKNGETFYFEVKFTRQSSKYFGAATLTEWEAALQNEDRFTFVVAFSRDNEWAFHEYTPNEFMAMSYVPPFKVFFNVAVGGDRVVASRGSSGAVSLTRGRLKMLSDLFSRFRNGEQ